MNAARIASLLRELADAIEAPEVNERSWLYFIRAEGGPWKIGIAMGPQRRREELQTGNHLQLRLVYSLPGGKSVERAAHAAFEHLRVRGEWFRDDWFIRDFVFTLQAIEAEAEAA
jgi:hypothetical protein